MGHLKKYFSAGINSINRQLMGFWGLMGHLKKYFSADFWLYL